MIRATVKPCFHLKEALGRPELEMEIQQGASLRDLLERLGRVSVNGVNLLDTETGGARSFYRILLGGHDCCSLKNRLETALTDGDPIAISPPVAGG